MKSILTLVLIFTISIFGNTQLFTANKTFTAGITLDVEVNTTTNQVYMQFVGPSDKYFAVGFNATSMSGSPYAVIANNNGISERNLGFHNSGNALAAQVEVISNEVNGGERTIVLKRDITETNANYYDFSSITDGSVINVIWARGNSNTFGSHNTRGATTLSFSAATDCSLNQNLTISACAEYVSPTGTNYTSSQTINETLVVPFACDTTYAINLTVGNHSFNTLNLDFCQSYTSPSGLIITEGGTFMDTIPNAAGCDSIFTINLNNLASTNTIVVTECEEYVGPSGTTYTSSGNYTDTIPNAAGCDSLIALNLTIGNNSTANISVTSCGDYNSPQGNVYTTAGVYMDTISNTSGCDSVITINLSIAAPSTNTLDVSACDSYTTPSGNIINGTTSTITIMDTIPNAVGCDSVLTINISFNQSAAVTVNENACLEFMSPAGNTYTNSGTYYDTLTTSFGCDSIITINLTIDTINLEYINLGADILMVQTGFESYQWMNCDGDTLIPGSTFNYLDQATTTANYACIITNGSCMDTTECENYFVGLNEEAPEYFTLYPNPTSDNVKLKSVGSVNNLECKLFNILGEDLKFKHQKIGEELIITLPKENGVYFVSVYQNGKLLNTQKVIKK